MSRLSRGFGSRGFGSRGFGGRGGRASGLPYDSIAALNPAVFVQFRYAVYNGVQVLFQDDACTVPVTEAWQMIGGVKDLDGNIIFTQPSEASRFLWTGSAAQLDGLDDYMDAPSPFLGPDTAAFISYDSIDLTNSLFQMLLEGGNTATTMGISARDDGRLYSQASLDGTLKAGIVDESFLSAGVVGGKVFGSDVSAINSDGQTGTNSGGSIYGVNSGNLAIGRRRNGSLHLKGEVGWVAIFDYEPTAEQEGTLRANP